MAAKDERKSADDWVMAALRVLAVSTISDVKVERLAKQLGVTKGSFYWHFADRGALLDAMRKRWVQLDTDQVIELVGDGFGESASGESVDSESGEPLDAIHRLFSMILRASGPLDGVEAAIREWSVHDKATAEVCAKVDERRLGFVSGLLVAAGIEPDEARVRADVLYRIVIGEYVWRRHGGAPIDVDAALRAVELISQP